MKKRIILGAIVTALGLLIAIGPHTIFHVCPIEDGGMLMKCNYTAFTESVIGGLIALLGIISIFISSAKIRLGFSISTAIVSVIAFLVPTLLVGVCKGAHMHCHAVALPALVILSTVLFILSIIDIIYFVIKRRKR